jgi:tetratricopeptide (TPR) repeat protein
MTERHGPRPPLPLGPPSTEQRFITVAWLALAMLVASLALGPRFRRALYLNRASVAVVRAVVPDGSSNLELPPVIDAAAVDGALRFAHALLELDGNDAAAWRQLGQALRLAGDALQAESALRQAIRDNPQDLPARDALAALYAATGQIDRAVSEWRQLRYPSRLVALGQRLAQEQRWPQAIAAYEAAVEVSPGYADAYYGLGWARYRWVGDVTGALSAFFAARDLDPGSPWPYTNIGDLYWAEGRFDDAIPWYEQARKVAPREPGLDRRLAEAYANRGAQLLLAGLPDQAEAAFRRALELDPGNAEAQRLLSTLSTTP